MATTRLQLPQADRLSLLVALLETISRNVSGIAALSQALSITPRQVHYYSHAASFLGLAEGEEGRFTLTPAGRRVLDADPDRRFESIVGLALAHSALAELLLPLADEAEIDLRAIAKAIEGAGYGPATAERRGQTIVGWFRQAGLDLSQSLRAGCPVRDQLSIFELPAASSREEEEEPRLPLGREEPAPEAPALLAEENPRPASVALSAEVPPPAPEEVPPSAVEAAVPEEAPAPPVVEVPALRAAENTAEVADVPPVVAARGDEVPFETPRAPAPLPSFRDGPVTPAAPGLVVPVEASPVVEVVPVEAPRSAPLGAAMEARTEAPRRAEPGRAIAELPLGRREEPAVPPVAEPRAPRPPEEEDVFGVRSEQQGRALREERARGPVYIGVALRASVAPGRATILCRLVVGERPAAQFQELTLSARVVEAIAREQPAVVAVAAPLWLPGEGIERDLIGLERADPDLWVARPWTRSPFVAALGFSRVELEGSAPGLAARGRFLREALVARGILPKMHPATQEDPGPRLIEVHPGLTLAALTNAAQGRAENVPPGRRLRRAVEDEAGPVDIPQEADTRHRDALAAAWTALKFARGAAWSPEGSSLTGGFVVVPFLG